LDNIIESNFALITKDKDLDLSEKAKLISNTLDIKIIVIGSEDDAEGRLDEVFNKYSTILVRPDKYTYGGVSNNSEVSNMIESLEDNFSLKV